MNSNVKREFVAVCLYLFVTVLFVQVRPEENAKFAEFISLQSYVAGGYDTPDGFIALNAEMEKVAKERHPETPQANRIFYLALPPSVFEPVTSNLKQSCMSKT